jgi:hypothetical protein
MKGDFQNDDEKTIYGSCSWCGAPGAAHSGGIMTTTGEKLEGFFCNSDHFKLWERWQRARVFVKLHGKYGESV